MAHSSEDPVLRSARREASVVFFSWACALAYTVTYCYSYGYERPGSDLKFVRLFWYIAFPDWVFWGIVMPWGACFLVSWWFSYWFVKDAELGTELEESDAPFGDVQGGNDA